MTTLSSWGFVVFRRGSSRNPRLRCSPPAALLARALSGTFRVGDASHYASHPPHAQKRTEAIARQRISRRPGRLRREGTERSTRLICTGAQALKDGSFDPLQIPPVAPQFIQHLCAAGSLANMAVRKFFFQQLHQPAADYGVIVCKQDTDHGFLIIAYYRAGGLSMPCQAGALLVVGTILQRRTGGVTAVTSGTPRHRRTGRRTR